MDDGEEKIVKTEMGEVRMERQRLDEKEKQGACYIAAGIVGRWHWRWITSVTSILQANPSLLGDSLRYFFPSSCYFMNE